MARRTHRGSTKSGKGTATSRIEATVGSTTPASSTAQTSEPNVAPASRTCLFWGTRPKSNVLAQPSVVVRSLPV